MRLDHTSIHPDLVDLLKRYDEGKALAEPGEGGMTPGTVVSLPIKVPVPQQSDSADDPHAPFEYDCQLVVRATDRTDGPAINQVAYVRGPEMVVKSQNMSSLDPARFDAILLAGSAVAAPGSTDLPANIDEAEAYFRSSEPPAHDDWGTGRKLSERYRGSFRKPLYDLPDQVSKALWELFEHVSVEEDDAPKELSDMLRFGSEPKDPKPQVVALSGSVQGGCWEVDFKVRVTDRAEGWWFEPRIAQIGETASKSPLTWASLESKKGSVEGFRVELPTIGTGRSYTFMLHGSTKPVAVSGPERRVQLPPERSVITVDIAKSGRPEIKS